MSNYIKTTNFTAKDSLPSGNPSKIVRGTEIDAEFDAIAVASATKLNALNPVMTGTLTVGSAILSEAELEILDGATVTTTELNYVDGVTSSIQTQLNNKLSLSGGAMTGAITTNSTFDGRDVATDGTKLDGIEASADVTDTANVTAAGALMDSEVTNLAQVKAFDSTDYATAAQGTLATAALPKSGGAMTGAITTNSTFDGVDIATRDGVLTSTTTTANAALPKSGGAMTGAITTNSTFDGRDVATDGTKLDGIEASADVTDTTNVVAALSTGTGISLSAGGEIGNTAPDQTVALTGGGGTTISGTYPSFTITSSSFALPTATATALGGIELFSDTDQTVAANAVTTTAARTYGIQLNSDDQAVINVPWTDTTYTVGDGGLTEINFTSADNTKLDGIEASADVTDTTNVVASLTAGSNITIAADGTIASTASGGGNETLQQTLVIGNTVTTDTKIQFRDSAIYINSSADGQLDIVADNEVQLAATTFDINAAVVTNGDVTVGDDLSLLSDSSKINFGLNSDVSLTHQHNLGLLLNTNRRLYFYDTTQYIHAPSSTTLDINATSEIELNAALIDVNGNLDVQGTLTVQGGITEDASTLSGTTPTLYMYLATNFVHTLTGATTYTFSNPATTGNASSFTLKIIQDSTARTITWPSTVNWAGGTAPTLTTTANGVDVFVFYTIDGGTNYYGFTAGQAMA